MLGVSPNQARYGYQNPDFPADCIKRNPKHKKSKLVHVPTLALFVKKVNKFDGLREMKAKTALIESGEEPSDEATRELAEDETFDPALTAPINESKRVQARWAAIRERMLAQKEAGELVSLRDVEAQIADAFLAFQDAVMSIPDRLAVPIAASTDAHECQQLIHDEIVHALRSAEPRIRSITQG